MANKPILKLGFTDYFENLDLFFIDILSKRFEVIRDDINPNYLIFCDEVFGQNNKTYSSESVVKIFYTGENRRPWNYQCHYAISFDHIDTQTHFRLPLYVFDHWVMVKKLDMPTIDKTTKLPSDVLNKTKFCGFISGNAAGEKRVNFFHKLSQYKQVDSAGPLFNNIGCVIPRGEEAAKNKNEFLKSYKFNLCFENSTWPGYCTEKLFHAFYMKTIPIYWGSPTAGLDFNPKAFLNWHNYLSDDLLLEKIKKLDHNRDMYIEMYMEPIFNQHGRSYMDTELFLDWFQQNIYRGVF